MAAHTIDFASVILCSTFSAAFTVHLPECSWESQVCTDLMRENTGTGTCSRAAADPGFDCVEWPQDCDR